MIDRRALLTGASAALAVAAATRPSHARKRAEARKKPGRLRLGDTVGLIAPASAVSAEQVDRAVHTIAGMGLTPRLGTHVADRHGYFAGKDRDRAEDVNTMFADASIRAIFAISGGWGGARLLPLLEWDVIRANPKLLIGYSDNTALHLAFADRAGFPTIHAPNAANRWEVASWNSLWRLAFTGERPVLGGVEEEALWGRSGRTINAGQVSGRLLGGNLTILSTLMGTPWMPDMTGAILFLEDVGEAPYRIDRMLQQLRLAGVFERVGGVVFGQCSRCAEPGGGDIGFQLDEILDQHFGTLSIPAFTGANIGHVANQLSLPVGVTVALDAGRRTITPLESAIE